jgi:uncharacterized cupin superfamily protein
LSDGRRWEPIPEAPLERTEGGLRPTADGWFVVNVADAAAVTSEHFGVSARFENRTEHPFPDFGINVRVLDPGQPNALYHRENAQEAFLVLRGECVAIVEDQERPMRQGDFLHTPSGTAHVLIGAGDGPSWILMVGTRKDPEHLLYPVSDLAARYGASAERETADAGEAYPSPKLRPGPLGVLW